MSAFEMLRAPENDRFGSSFAFCGGFPLSDECSSRTVAPLIVGEVSPLEDGVAGLGLVEDRDVPLVTQRDLGEGLSLEIPLASGLARCLRATRTCAAC